MRKKWLNKIFILIAFTLLFACEEDIDIIEPKITKIVPESDGPGVEVMISGSGFGDDISALTVSFSGVVAPIISVSDSLIITVVPEGAQTGKIFIQANDVQTSSAQDFVVLKGMWTQKSTIPASRLFGAAVGFTYDGKGILGSGSDNGAFLDEFWEYDHTNDAWHPLSPILNGKRHLCSSFVIGENAYVGLGRKDGETDASREFYRYNIIEDSWAALNDFPDVLPVYKDYRTAFGYEEKAYLILENKVWVYDPVLDDWSIYDDYPGKGTSGLIAEVVGSDVYIGLGFSNALDWWKYDVQNNTWLQLEDFPSTISWNVQSFIINDKIYVVGKECWEYNPQSALWTQKTSHPDGCRFATTFTLQDKGYLGAGISLTNTSQLFNNDFWEFDPEE